MDLETIRRNSNLELFRLQELFLQTSSEQFVEKFREIEGDLRSFFNSKGLKSVPSEVIVAHLKNLYDELCSTAYSLNMHSTMETYKGNRDRVMSENISDQEKEKLLGYEVETILKKCEALKPHKDVTDYSMLGVKTQSYDVPDYDRLISTGTEEIVAQLELINGNITDPALKDQIETEVKDAIRARVSEAANISIDYISNENKDSITGLNKQVMDVLKAEKSPEAKETLSTEGVFNDFSSLVSGGPKTVDYKQGLEEAKKSFVSTDGMGTDAASTSSNPEPQVLSTTELFTDKRFTGTQSIPTTNFLNGDVDLNAVNPFEATDAIEKKTLPTDNFLSPDKLIPSSNKLATTDIFDVDDPKGRSI